MQTRLSSKSLWNPFPLGVGGMWWFSASCHQWPFCRVALCWVKAYCLQLLWIFVSLKSSVQRWTSLFTLWKPAEGDHFKHLQKAWLLSMHNNVSKITDLVITCLFETCLGLVTLMIGIITLHKMLQGAFSIASATRWWKSIKLESVGLISFVNLIFFLFLSDCSKSNLSKDQAQPSSSMNMPQSFGTAMGFSLSETLSVASLPGPAQNVSRLHTSEDSIVYLAPTADINKCWPIRPTLRNELDTFSVHFYVFFGPNISIPPDRAAVFAINLMPVLDSGGVLNMELKLNMVSPSYGPFPACFEANDPIVKTHLKVLCNVFICIYCFVLPMGEQIVT